MFVWGQIPEPYRAMGSIEFAKLLLKDGKVAVSPGIGFGEYGDDASARADRRRTERPGRLVAAPSARCTTSMCIRLGDRRASPIGCRPASTHSRRVIDSAIGTGASSAEVTDARSTRRPCVTLQHRASTPVAIGGDRAGAISRRCGAGAPESQASWRCARGQLRAARRRLRDPRRAPSRRSRACVVLSEADARRHRHLPVLEQELRELDRAHRA